MLTLLMLASLPAQAAEVELSGLIFAHYGYALQAEAQGANEFDVDRVYMTARSTLGEGWSTRVTTDLGRTGAEDDEKLRVYLKYAYLQKELGDELTVLAGASATPYCGAQERFWGHRWVSKTMADRNKVLSTSDFGVAALGTHMSGLIDWHAGIFNGEGYGRPEQSSSKTAQARLTVDPLARSANTHLPLTLSVSQDMLMAENEQAKQVLAASTGISTPVFLGLGEVLMDKQGPLTGVGYSATMMLRKAELATALLRYDSFDPDQETDGDSSNTWIAGLTRELHDTISAGLIYERVTPQTRTEDVSHGVFLRMQAGL